MAKKPTTLPTHKYWYYFPGKNEPQRVEEGIIPTKPYERFETQSDCIAYINTHINGYCSSSKSLNGESCPRRFECAKFSKFHSLASEGKFRGLHSIDIFKFAPFDEKEPGVCKEFEEKL